MSCQARERCGIGVVGPAVPEHGPEGESTSTDLAKQAGKLGQRG